MLSDFVRINGYKYVGCHKHLDLGYVLIELEAESKVMCCWRCGTTLEDEHSRHRIRAKYLPLFRYDCFVVVWRRKGFCSECKKIRSEAMDFLSDDSPHLTKAYEGVIEDLTEIAAVSRVAEFTGQEGSTVWRLDFRRLTRLKTSYKIPKVTHLSVDEVYARKRHDEGETRNDRFFTIITDMKSRKVIWVSDSRRKEALDEFYRHLGSERCKEIRVVAQDQHEDYVSSTKEHCPNASIVFDRFHVIKSFNEAMNEARKYILKAFDLNKSEKKALSGKFKYVLSKRAANRFDWEKKSLAQATKINKLFVYLELIKESVLSLFDHTAVSEAEKHFEQIGKWIKEAGFPDLKNWYKRLDQRWSCIEAYFESPTTSALSEGVNNVIKTIKKRAYGYKRMEYFKLKIMQVCGYLTTKGLKELALKESMT